MKYKRTVPGKAGQRSPLKQDQSRIEQRVPKKGEVVIFNRSQYEDVLVVRVHKLVPKEVWKGRYELINDFEKKLFENGTHILKSSCTSAQKSSSYASVSVLTTPARHWKISENDYAEREFWDDYISAYKEAIPKTSIKHAPWLPLFSSMTEPAL